jgi:hypothetical protein
LLSAVVIVWNDDQLTSCALDAFELQRYLAVTGDTASLETEHRGDFADVVRGFYDQQFVEWPVLDRSMIPDTSEIAETQFWKTIEECLHREFEAQVASKPFRLKEKQAAKADIGVDCVERIITFLKPVISKEKITKADRKDAEDFFTRLSERR